MLPLYFAASQINYARYGLHYVEMLKNLDQSHPGLGTLLLKKRLTAQAQEKYPCRTAINQRGEQSINRDAKTTGKLPSFFFLLLPQEKTSQIQPVKFVIFKSSQKNLRMPSRIPNIFYFLSLLYQDATYSLVRLIDMRFVFHREYFLLSTKLKS